MRDRLPSRCCLIAALLTVTPYTPQHFMELAKSETAVPEKISLLRRLIHSFPLDRQVTSAQEDLINLLQGSNRYSEALQEYKQWNSRPRSNTIPDFKLLDLLLKTGHYADVLRLTTHPPIPTHDLLRDLRILEVRTQALLARGRYRLARESVDQWLGMYEQEGIEQGRFVDDVHSLQSLRRHLQTLERVQGSTGKALFTASVPDSLTHWSHRRQIPLVFFKLLPADSLHLTPDAQSPDRNQNDTFFQKQVDDLNRGFQYLSSGAFSLKYNGLYTLYVKQEDLGPQAAHSSVLTARVYIHTIPPLYRLAGHAFVVLVDYGEPTDDAAAYMGDGLIHLTANKLQSVTLMHEILHGLGATHQEWDDLIHEGYQFDAEDRGLMTFEKGELRDLGLEEKNRALLGWPHVAALHLDNDSATHLPPNSLAALLIPTNPN